MRPPSAATCTCLLIFLCGRSMQALASVDQSAPTTETDAQQPDFMLPHASSVADRRRTVPRESSFHGATSTLLEDHSFASDGSINHAALLPAADSVGSLGSEITDGASRGRQTLSHAAPLPQELPPVHEGTLDSFVSSGSEAVGTGARVDEHEPASLGIQSTCSADATMSDGDALDLCDLLNASGGAALCLPAPVAFKERADAIITCSSVAIDRGRTWQDCTSSQCNECGRGDAVLLGSPPAEPTSSPSEVGGSTSHSAHAAKKAIAIPAAATSVSPDMAPVTTESPGDAVSRVQQEQQDLLAVQRRQRLGQLRAQSKAGRAPRSAIRQQLWR